MYSRERIPNRFWKVPPRDADRLLAADDLDRLTRPPQAPAPSRLVILSCFTVPTDGQAWVMLAAVICLVQDWDVITPSYVGVRPSGRDSRPWRCGRRWRSANWVRAAAPR